MNGSTPIMVACKEGKYALVEKLLERGASVSDIDLVCLPFVKSSTNLHYQPPIIALSFNSQERAKSVAGFSPCSHQVGIVDNKSTASFKQA